MAGVDVVLTALGDPTRRRVVEVLADKPASAGEIAAQLRVSPALLTRHLRVLRQTGVVEAILDPGDHRRHVYELVPDPVVELRDWADRVAAFRSRQLDAFVDHARRQRTGARTGGERRARR